MQSKVEKIVHVPVIHEEQRIVQNPIEVVVEVPQPQVVVKVVEVPKITVEEKIIKVPKITHTVVDTAAWLQGFSLQGSVRLVSEARRICRTHIRGCPESAAGSGGGEANGRAQDRPAKEARDPRGDRGHPQGAGTAVFEPS